MNIRHALYLIPAAAVLLLAATACTQDELADDTRLPEGEYPLIINATGLQAVATPASTRATVDGNWDGVTSVALSVGGMVKEYSVTTTDTEKKTATLSRENDPFWWTSREDITVSAWWPYDAADITQMPAVKVAGDQSKLTDYQKSDFISAENQTVQFDNPTLEFSHRTARVTINLKPGTGITSVDGATVSLTSLSADNENPTVIKTYNASSNRYEALAAPQTVAAGEPFIQVDLNGGTFYFRPQSDVELVANSCYIYTINVNAKGLELAGCTIGEWADGGHEEGTAEDLGYFIQDDGSYAVYTANGLKEWAKAAQSDLSLNCTLTENINMAGKEWTPIPNYAGTFDGGGKTITGLTINKSTMNVGLFASIAEGGTVKNLTLDDVNITASSSNVGAIAGENRGIIENCSVSGSVTSSRMYSDCVGGIVGQNNGTITGCTVEGSVKAKDADSVGGIAGLHNNGSITDCHSSATVEGLSRVGGIAGKSNASITACSSTGDVTATKNSLDYSWAGGVVGEFSGRSQLIACYATGNVKGTGKHVGGVVGDNVYNAVIACYATGSVTGASGSTGGVVGRNFKDDFSSGTVTASYWDNNQSSGIGEDLTNNGETTKVTSGDWTEAMNAMNMALTNAGTDWRYATGSWNIPLTLYKQ